MREIKFRAWDEQRKKMFYDVGILIMPHGSVYIMEQVGPDVKAWPMIIPLQFTGLKDREGTEIYEGDLLQDGDLIRTYLVSWWEIGTGFLLVDPKNPVSVIGGWFNEGNVKKLRVVGNIFECKISREVKS